MKKRHLLFFSTLLLGLFLSGCSINDQSKEPEKQKKTDEKAELTVSAATSLQPALTDIKKLFEERYPDVEIIFNFGASGSLQQQIAQGAPVDFFFSAAENHFDTLVEKGLIDQEKRVDLIGNEMVLVVPKKSDKEIEAFEDLMKAEKISIGIPEAVPAGKYAKEILEHLTIWKAAEEKVVYAKDVRQVLTYVETANVDAGVVYKTDALSSTEVKIAAKATEKMHTPIIYPAGIVKESAHFKEAQLFYEYLQSKEAINVLEKYGFKELN